MSDDQIPPIVDMIGAARISHGERGHELDSEHPEACLCGHPDYFRCPDWLAGHETITAYEWWAS